MDKFTSRVDTDMYKSWADSNPELFVQSVFDFVKKYPKDEWDMSVKMYTDHIIRFTAQRIVK